MASLTTLLTSLCTIAPMRCSSPRTPKIVQEIYRNGANEESQFISFSVGKSLTSSLLGLALAQGALPSLDAPVTTYVPKLRARAMTGLLCEI